MTKQDIYKKETAKTNGKANLHKSAMEIIKSAKTLSYTSFHGSYIQDGCQYVCDGYRAIKIKNAIDLPEAPALDHPDMSKFFNSTNSIELQLPDIAELKLYIKLQKAEGSKKHEILWDFGDNMPQVNANYLLTIMEADLNLKAYSNDNNANSPIIFKSDDIEALLMPVRKVKKSA
jgi:alkyl sulfatase BDS1-like metallo-beta-lactamase superfamily hydrolase